MKKLIVNIGKCDDCPYYGEIYPGDGSIHRLCCHSSLEDPMDIPEGLNMSNTLKCPIKVDRNIMGLIVKLWDLFPAEFDNVLYDNDWIPRDEAYEVVADDHDPCW